MNRSSGTGARENYGPTKIKPDIQPRPMVIIVEEEGYRWLCDKNVDPDKDPGEQGCWKCGATRMAFTRRD